MYFRDSFGLEVGEKVWSLTRVVLKKKFGRETGIFLGMGPLERGRQDSGRNIELSQCIKSKFCEVKN